MIELWDQFLGLFPADIEYRIRDYQRQFEDLPDHIQAFISLLFTIFYYVGPKTIDIWKTKEQTVNSIFAERIMRDGRVNKMFDYKIG
eukprot:UN19817